MAVELETRSKEKEVWRKQIDKEAGREGTKSELFVCPLNKEIKQKKKKKNQFPDYILSTVLNSAEVVISPERGRKGQPAARSKKRP